MPPDMSDLRLFCWSRYDECGENNLQSFAKFSVMRDSLNATGKPIVFSYEPHITVPIAWPPFVGNLWRIGNDMGPYFGDVTGLSYHANAWANVAGPGQWTDPGYLAVGMGLPLPDSRTQLAVWAIMKSILLVDADLSHLGGGSDTTNKSNPYLQLLINRELISINQDSLGFIGRLVNSSTVGGGAADDAGADTGGGGSRYPTPAPAMLPPPTTSVASGDFQGVTPCQPDPARVTPAQRWRLSPSDGRVSSATGGSSGGGLCLTVADTPPVAGSAVTMRPCLRGAGGATQRWSGLELVTLTVAPVIKANSSTLLNGTRVPLCLAANGSGHLYLEGCTQDPPTCNSTRCEFSARVRQLWYHTNLTKQLLCTFTNVTIPQDRQQQRERPDKQQQEREGTEGTDKSDGGQRQLLAGANMDGPFPGLAEPDTANRLCGSCCGAHDNSSALCIGTTSDGRLQSLTLIQMKVRCATDSSCVGFSQISANGGGYFRPVSEVRGPLKATPTPWQTWLKHGYRPSPAPAPPHPAPAPPGPPHAPPALINVPLCLATAPNADPPQPPIPPKWVENLPLKVWGAKLSGGRVAVVLSNGDNNATQEMTAMWCVTISASQTIRVPLVRTYTYVFINLIVPACLLYVQGRPMAAIGDGGGRA